MAGSVTRGESVKIPRLPNGYSAEAELAQVESAEAELEAKQVELTTLEASLAGAPELALESLEEAANKELTDAVVAAVNDLLDIEEPAGE